jgi:hypothetical protein
LVIAPVLPAKPEQTETTMPQARQASQFERREPDRFDWSAENPNVVLHYQPATMVYENPNGQIIIRQEDQYGDTENEHYLIIDPDQVTKLFTRALSLAAEINARGGQ